MKISVFSLRRSAVEWLCNPVDIMWSIIHRLTRGVVQFLILMSPKKTYILWLDSNKPKPGVFSFSGSEIENKEPARYISQQTSDFSKKPG